MKRLMAAWRSTIERNTPRLSRRRVSREKGVSTSVALLPAPDRRLGAAHLAHDRKRAHTVAGHQHDPRPFDMLLSAVAIRHDRLEPSTIIGANLDLDPLAHAAIVPRPLASQDSFDCIGALVSLS